MKLGLIAGYSGKKISIPIDTIKHAERLGYDSVWTAEAYGSDAVTPAAWMLAHTTKIKVGTAIMQMPGAHAGDDRDDRDDARRSCRTAASSSALGTSGPQVVEGWHGVPYGKPLTRLREYIAIMRKILAREDALEFDGEHYQIPYTGEGATGLGKPLKSILHAKSRIPIYTASIDAGGVQAAAEVADGFFPIWMDPEQFDVFKEPIRKGSRRRAAASRCGLRRRAVRHRDHRRRRRSSACCRSRQHGALHRRHGRARQELLQRLREAPRLRGRGGEDPGSVPGRQNATKRWPRCRTS